MIDIHSVKVGDILRWRKKNYYFVFKKENRGREGVSMFIIKSDKANENQNIVEDYSLWMLENDDWEKVE